MDSELAFRFIATVESNGKAVSEAAVKPNTAATSQIQNTKQSRIY